MIYRRVAVYVVPDGLLGTLGASWLGWDSAAGRTVAHPDLNGLDVSQITKRPRKYGLHATIKPPMVLADGKSIAGVIDATRQCAQNLRSIDLGPLAVRRIGNFLALVPDTQSALLQSYAAHCVEQLDPYRAPLSEQILARYRRRNLTPAQQQNLELWGYPYVMGEFKFHITLTGPLKDAQSRLTDVAAYFAPVLQHSFLLDHLAVLGEDDDGFFHLIERLALGPETR